MYTLQARMAQYNAPLCFKYLHPGYLKKKPAENVRVYTLLSQTCKEIIISIIRSYC